MGKKEKEDWPKGHMLGVYLRVPSAIALIIVLA
jgi:hypothetical protein